MASKRRLRRKQCGNKRAFDKAEDAAKIVRDLRWRKKITGSTRIYRCKWCGKFHWGHHKG